MGGEEGDSMRKRMNPGIPVSALFLLLGVLSGIAVAAQREPERIFLDFTDGYLVFVPEGGTIQFSAAEHVLFSAADWEISKLKTFLYHLRRKTWKETFWKLDTRRRRVWEIANGIFGDQGGKQLGKPFKLELVGGDGDKPPDRILIRFPRAQMICAPKDGTIQILAGGAVLSDGTDWQVAKLKPYLYHLGMKTWESFFWKVNTDRKQAWKVEKGAFGQLGGTDTELKVIVRIAAGS